MLASSIVVLEMTHGTNARAIVLTVHRGTPHPKEGSMFEVDRFVADCRAALAEQGSEAIRAVLARAVAEPEEIIRVLGEPTRAAAGVVFHAPDLTILNVVWGPRQWTLPHNHNNRAVIGMYGGREDNIFWRRLPQAEGGRIEAAGARSLCPGEVTILGRDIIHSVTNPLGKLSAALHVYDGDLLVTPDRSHWDAETLTEAAYDPELVSPMFGRDLVGAG
jgi:predicted metal-dependent enzyme (double-stranded beta helix superfamily)